MGKCTKKQGENPVLSDYKSLKMIKNLHLKSPFSRGKILIGIYPVFLWVHAPGKRYFGTGP